MPPEVTLDSFFLQYYDSLVTNKKWQFAIYSNVLYTVLEIGSGRAKNGVFLDFVCHDTGTKMCPRAQIFGKWAAILNNFIQF